MLDKPQIIQTTDQLAAVIHLTIPKDEIQNVMGPSLQELYGTLAKQGLKPAGPWFTHHFEIVPDSWDFEICVPVSAPVAPAGLVKPGRWPAMKVARTVYQGGFEGLGDAWGELMDWVEANGHKPADDLWERYLTGPESSPNPADWCTELSRPLVD